MSWTGPKSVKPGTLPKVCELGARVRVIARPQLVGNVRELVTPSYVKVEFDGIEELVGVSTDRIELVP